MFFSMHDVNGDGFLDQQEVEALLTLEIRKMYDEKNPEDDPNEMVSIQKIVFYTIICKYNFHRWKNTIE